MRIARCYEAEIKRIVGYYCSQQHKFLTLTSISLMIIKNYFTTGYHKLLLMTLLASSTAYSAPQIQSVEGNISDGNIITIKGTGFTSKTNPAPLFWWQADDGSTPSSLGRTAEWASAFQGEISTALIAPGSKQSIAWDHGLSESNSLARVDFDSTELYLHRKYYEDYDVVENVAIRTWVKDVSGTVKVGDTITGETSGAVGVLNHIKPDDGVHGPSLFYSNAHGTLSSDTPTYFLQGEQMVSSSGANMTNAEPYSPTTGGDPGVQRSFNYKMIRFWSGFGQADGKSIFIGLQGAENSGFRITPEHTDNTRWWNSHFTNPMQQMPFRWNIDEVAYRASSEPDVSDARWDYYQNGTLASDATFISRTSDRPGLYNQIYQSQVSNGAQPGSVVFYDSLYIDDSWHRVLICNGNTLDKCNTPEIQIPATWNDNQITVQLNLGGLNSDSNLHLYVIGKDGTPNPEGFRLCPTCPLPPIPY